MSHLDAATAPEISIVLPAKNEAASLRDLLPRIAALGLDTEVIVVDDGSTDETAEILAQHRVRRVWHPHSLGNGAAIKSGVRVATGRLLICMDADGQHRPEQIPQLLKMLDQGYDMVVGARAPADQASPARRWANAVYNRLASWMTDQQVDDLTSGFRATYLTRFRRFLYLLPNGFSYPATSTMAFFRSGFSVGYVPIDVDRRVGSSHIRLFRDGFRFFLIIFRIGALYSPLKLFLPISLFFSCAGLANYAYTFFVQGRFTNMSALMLSVSVVIFLIGLVSEQITALMYMKPEEEC